MVRLIAEDERALAEERRVIAEVTMQKLQMELDRQAEVAPPGER